MFPNVNINLKCKTTSYVPDVKVTPKKTLFATGLFCKPTFSGLGISFFMFFYCRFKVNVNETLITRA